MDEFRTSDPAEREQAERAKKRLGLVLNGKWTIDRLLGIGGMAVVYEATHRNRKRGAIKMLHPQLGADPGIKDRFLKEGYVANSVGHQGAVRVDDDDIAEDGSPYLVMELLEGETLEARWERLGRRLPLKDALEIADQLLDVLIAAHAKGIVHRDLKPENLFLTRAGVLKVLDFGIARLRATGERASRTRTGSLMGTPVFMAPEQARGRWDAVSTRTDLWAVGATLFTLLSGQYVHEAETSNEVMILAATQRARSLASVFPEVPVRVAEIVDRALMYESDQRFQDAASMQAAVREAAASIEGSSIVHPSGRESVAVTAPAAPGVQTVAPATVSSRAKQRNGTRVTLVVTGLGLSLALVAGVLMFTRTKASDQVSPSASSEPSLVSTNVPVAGPRIEVGPPASAFVERPPVPDSSGRAPEQPAKASTARLAASGRAPRELSAPGAELKPAGEAKPAPSSDAAGKAKRRERLGF